MKNKTIKTFADKLRADIKRLGETEALEKAKFGGNSSSFDHMPFILKEMGWKEGEIFLIDNDQEALIKLIGLVRDLDCEEVKIGVLFRVDGHTTPFCIEKKFLKKKGLYIEEDTDEIIEYCKEKERVVVYNTDSTAMDIDQGDSIRALVREVAKVADVYSLAFEDPNGSIVRDFKRQSDEGSCATFSLHDIRQIIDDRSFYEFVMENSKMVMGDINSKIGVNDSDSNNALYGLYNLKKLPPALIATMQSINGKEEAGAIIRNGLRTIIGNQEVSSEDEFRINGELINLASLIGDIDEEGCYINPVINIMNEHNSLLYNRGITEFSEQHSSRYNLNKKRIDETSSKIEEFIHDLATKRYENGSDSSEDNENEEEYYDRKVVTSEVMEAIQNTYLTMLYNKFLEAEKRIANRRTESGILDAEISEDDIIDEMLNYEIPKSNAKNYDKVYGAEPDQDISEEEFINSAFAKGSNTAKLLERRKSASNKGFERC